ncbi:MAG: T9SS type A sorting domain-containing protein, partial [Bacteroidales bacterium]|nr:T9SS type A sorting domain-containing protein [Bacteroidales bacterium]
YPNPACDFIQVESGEPVQSVVLYNTLGQKVYENASVESGSFRIPVQSFCNGVYLIRVQTAKGSAVEKITVAR